MRNFRFLGAVTLIFCVLFTSCEEDEVLINPVPAIYINQILQTRLEHQLGVFAWDEFTYETIFIGSEGKYCTVQSGSESFPASINWHMEDGIQKFDITSDDRNNERHFVVNSYDENHLLLEIDWGPERQEWLFTTGTGALTGTIVDNNWLPVQDAIIMVKNSDNIIGQVQSDSHGYFGINIQTYGFAGLTSANSIQVYMDEKEDAGKDISVSDQECAYYLIRMEEGISGINFGTLTGRVTDDSDAPLENVIISYGDGTNSVTTDSNGEFTINLPVGNNTVTVSIEGYDDETMNLSVESLGEYENDFVMDISGYTLGGSVILTNGTVVANAVLTLEDGYGNTVESVSSGSDGTFSIDNIEDGVYIVSVSAAGMQFVPTDYPVYISGGNMEEINFLGLEEGKTGIGGRITHWDTEEPLADVSVTAANNTTTSNSDGYYLMELPYGGDIIFKAEKNGFLNRYDNESIYVGELAFCNISMAPPSSGVNYTQEGIVYDGSAMVPIYGATVNVVNNGQTTTDINGNYSVNIDIYDESIGQIIEVITSKSGYINDTLFLDIHRDLYFDHNLYISPDDSK